MLVDLDAICRFLNLTRARPIGDRKGKRKGRVHGCRFLAQRGPDNTERQKKNTPINTASTYCYKRPVVLAPVSPFPVHLYFLPVAWSNWLMICEASSPSLSPLQVPAEFLLGLCRGRRDLSVAGHCTGSHSAEISEPRGHDDAVGFLAMVLRYVGAAVF